MKTTLTLLPIEFYRLLFRSDLGIFGPVLLILLGLWLGRGERSPWYVKAVLLGLLLVLFLIMFRVI